MPSVDPTFFAVSDVMAMTTFNGQASMGSTFRAHQSPFSSSRLAKPPKIDRAADPEPLRAHIERSDVLISSLKAASIAVRSAANPEADDAKPALAGKLLKDSIDSGGRE
tara:strand:- start:7 stop:333 length:327 start_codon:yes stop_codon:yes gene_type:complete